MLCWVIWLNYGCFIGFDNFCCPLRITGANCHRILFSNTSLILDLWSVGSTNGRDNSKNRSFLPDVGAFHILVRERGTINWWGRIWGRGPSWDRNITSQRKKHWSSRPSLPLMHDAIVLIMWQLGILVQMAGECHEFTKVSCCYPSDAVITVTANATQSGTFALAQFAEIHLFAVFQL